MIRINQVLNDKDWTSKFIFWMGISFVLHLVASYFSVGFLHFDEHFQILEFANYKLGNVGAAELTPEFHLKMRPWFQPWIFYSMAKFFQILGLEDPHIVSFIFRFFSSLLGLASLGIMGLLSYFWMDGKAHIKKMVLPLLALTWFFPYFHARGSSDNWGASFFIMGLGIFLLWLPNNYQKDKFIPNIGTALRYRISWSIASLSGVLMGLSFLSRFQMGVCILFFFLWGLLYGRIAFSSLIVFSLGVLSTLLAGTFIDSWGYGTFVFTPYNYVYENMIKGMAASISVAPWWDYFRLIILRGYPPLSLLFLFSTFIFWGKFKKHPLTWVTLPFFIIHMGIGHKELRFLMPIIFLVPIMLWALLPGISLEKKWVKKLGLVFVGMNMLLLTGVVLKPARVSVKFYEYFSKIQENKTELFYLGRKPYVEVGAKMEYFRPKNLKIHLIKDVPALHSMIENLKSPKWILLTRGKFLKEIVNYPNCPLEYLTYPEWLLKFNVGNWIKRSSVWALFKCHP